MNTWGSVVAPFAIVCLSCIGCGSSASDDPGRDVADGSTHDSGQGDASADSTGQGQCPAGQTFCPGCPGQSGGCFTGGCPGFACLADGSGGAPPPDGDAGDAQAAMACGAQTCGAGMVCVEPCCGGNALLCTARPDGGVCPADTTEVPSCAGVASGPGCQPKPCTPPPPFCMAVPPSCGGVPKCSCLPQACSSTGGCASVVSGKVQCICA